MICGAAGSAERTDDEESENMIERAWRKRQLNTSRGRTANAGFSLVELLIAVTILAIIVIPLLHMFVTSTRINVKSRQTLRATTVAQDIMEGLKAYTLDEVKTQFSLPDGSPGSDYFYPSEGFYIVNSKMIQGGVREITELETPRDTDGKFLNPDNPNNEIYYFGIENLKMQGGEYDALIKLDASTYTEAKVGIAANAHDNVFNGAYYADTISVSETSNGGSATDSSYHEDKDLTANVLKDVKDQIEAAGGSLPDDGELDSVIAIKKREITVVLEDAGSNDTEGNPQCKATITFKYTCEYNGNTYTSYGKAGSAGGAVNGVTRTFSSGNFYLFYYPIYASAEVDQILFQINDDTTLCNEDNPLLRSITLAKQIKSEIIVGDNVIVPDMSDSELFSKESAYRAKVSINPQSSSAVTNNLVFRTNIDTNMARQARQEDPDGSVYWDNIFGITASYNPHLSKVDLIGENVSDKVTDVIYDIEIKVYKTGAAQHFGDPNFESLDDVQRLATITNLD